ncbi:zinc finger MYND domain-containing protein 15 [Pogona vitticeps]|uniref:Zinc finger MYND domain-containing protein 15 n=1 Tax=Pogona vitticeps TaxID=103695 RepID=A0ABM5EJV1_9SAUR
MEFVTGYRAEILDFAELFFGWYRRFLLEAAHRQGSERRKRQEGSIRRLPPDPAPWVLHVLPNHALAFTVADPGQQVGGRFYSEEALALRDLDRFITFVGAVEEEEEEATPEAGQTLWRVEHLLLVTDEHGTILGFDFLLGGSPGASGHEPLEPRAFALLCYCMMCPLGAGEPRRPKTLTVGDATLHKSLEPLLSRLGVKMSKGLMRGWGPRPAFTFPTTRVQACHVCKKHSFEGQVTACQHCRAVLYCSERCRKLDWSRSPEDIGHQFWCQHMAGYMSHAQELANLPFTFAAEVTSETFNKEGFLSARGLTRGYWAGESMLVRAPDYGVGLQAPPKKPMDFLQSGNPFEALRPEGGTALPPAPPEPPAPRTFFGSWKEYYQWRGLPLGAPLAVILTYPLTMYYIITQLAPQHFPELNILNKQSLKIHVVEAGKEFGVLMAFWELSVLLPHVSLELLFVGGALPPELDGQQFLLQRDEELGVSVQPGLAPRAKGGRRELQLGFSARPYHLLQAPKPDLVIGYNSGFALQETWLSCLPRLQSLRVPAYFTECSEYSCAVDEAAVSMATGGSASPAQINPFRSPFRRVGTDNAMPWYSNAFVFHLIYKASAGAHRPTAATVPAPPPQPLAPGGNPEPPEPARSRRKEKRQQRAAGRRRK